MPGLQEDGVPKSSLGCMVRLMFLYVSFAVAGEQVCSGLVEMATDKSPLLRTAGTSVLRTDSGLVLLLCGV